MLENKMFEGIHYSRFIASWVSKKGKIYKDEFEAWLRRIVINDKHIPEDVIQEIYELGTNGKLELEASASVFKF